MAEIDSLEISIQSNIDKVNKNLDLLISKMGMVTKGISAIGSNKGLEEFAKEAKTISETMGNMTAKVSQSMKPIETQAKKVVKTIDQIVKEANAKTMNLTPQLNMGNLDAEAKKYENQLRNMQNQLNKVLAMPSAEKQDRTIERLVANINEAKNALAKIQSINTEIPEINIKVNTGNAEKNLSDFEKGIEEFKSNIKSIEQVYGGFQNIPIGKLDTPIENLKIDLEELRTSFPQAQNVISNYENELKRLENISSKLTIAPKIEKFDTSALDKGTATIKERISEIQQMFAESGKDFYFTGNSEQLDKEIQKVTSELDGLYKRQDKAIELGKIDTSAFKELIRDIENAINRLGVLEAARPEALNRTLEENAEKARNAANQLKQFEANLQQLRVPPVQEDSLVKLQNALNKTEADLEKLRAKLANGLMLGKITQDIDDSGYRNLREQIALTKKQADALREKIGNTSGFERFKQSMSGISASGKQVNKAFTSLYNALKKLNSGINSVLSKIGKLVKSMFSLGNAAEESSKGFNLNLKTILKYGFGIRSVYVLVNKLRSAVKEGMGNLIQYSDETNASVSMLKSSLNQFKNSAAAAFAPILNAIAPVLNQLIQLFITATNAVNQFFAALTGQSSWIKAKYVYDDVAESIGGAAKAAKGALQPFDALNNLTTPSSGGAGGALAEDMFETLPLDDKIKDLSDKVKDIMSKLFDPLKTAWNSVGKKVMDAWKKALNNVWKMIKDIGRDFLKVWQEERTIGIFKNILEIIKDIGLVISNLAENFRKAWNENDTGLKILENIRNVIDVIIANIKHAADATVEWAANLNFTPLLEAFERFTASLEPVADALSGILTDFYEQVLLPLGKWVLEEGLKELLDVFTAFNEKVDWAALRENLSEFWKHLEPFAETVGEGLIIFIERVSDLVANFLNSEEFINFLHNLEDWMDSVEPEDVADGIEKLAKALIALKAAAVALSGLSSLGTFVGGIKNLFPSGKQGANTKETGKTLGTGLFSGLSNAWTSLGGLSGILTTDLATIMGAGTAAEIGLTIGVGIAAAIATAIGGFNIGKVIGEALNPEDAEWYDNFKWLGEGGFFDQILPDTSTFDSFLQDMGHLFQGAADMATDFENNPVIANLTDALIGPWGEAALNVPNKIEELKGAFDNAKEFLVDLSEKTVETVESMKKKAIETWEVVAPKLSETWEKLKTDASTKFENIKTSVSDMWSELKENTIKTWDAIKTAIKLPINAIIGFINKMISGVISGINSMTSALSAINFKVPDGFPMIGGKEFKINIPKVNAPQIPYLANGAVFNGGNPYLAIVNDQPRGQTNIEAPLKTIQEALQIELQNFGNNSGFNNGIGYESGNSEALLNETRMQNQLLRQQNELLERLVSKDFGITESDIGQAAQNYSKDYYRRTGKPAYT